MDSDTGFWAYWKLVARRAWADTLAFYPFSEKRRAAFLHVAGQILTAVVLTFVVSEAQVMEELNVFLAFAVATAVTFLFVLIFNAGAAPSRIHNDISLRLDLIEKKLAKSSASRDAAEPLRDKIRELNHQIDSAKRMMDEEILAGLGLVWERSVIQLMRKYNLPENEIHMFETISSIPQSSTIGPMRYPEVEAALNAKRAKLRLIISRLLQEGE